MWVEGRGRGDKQKGQGRCCPSKLPPSLCFLFIFSFVFCGLQASSKHCILQKASTLVYVTGSHKQIHEAMHDPASTTQLLALSCSSRSSRWAEAFSAALINMHAYGAFWVNNSHMKDREAPHDSQHRLLDMNSLWQHSSWHGIHHHNWIL